VVDDGGPGVRVAVDGHVATVELGPGAPPAAGLAAALGSIVDDLRFAVDVRVVVLRAGGPDALAILDDPVPDPPDAVSRSEAERMRQRYERVRLVQERLAALADLPQPVVAALRGRCVALGLELALACDVRVAADDATFSLPAVRRGAPTVGLGEVRLAAEVGPGTAKLLALTGREIDAAEALRIGLVQDVVPAADLDATVAALAADLAANAPLAVQGIKRTVGFWAAQGASEVQRFAAASAAVALASADHARATPPFSGT
jgi:enoyl-CoA hydratase/carnithine racemase